jgi:hypothetical protein
MAALHVSETAGPGALAAAGDLGPTCAVVWRRAVSPERTAALVSRLARESTPVHFEDPAMLCRTGNGEFPAAPHSVPGRQGKL